MASARAPAAPAAPAPTASAPEAELAHGITVPAAPSGVEARGEPAPERDAQPAAKSLSRRSQGWGEDHLARLQQGQRPGTHGLRSSLAAREARESAGESQATRDLLTFRRLLAAHLEDQMVLARTSAWMQMQAYLVQWTRAAGAAADAAEAAAASFGGSLRQVSGLPPPVAMPSPWDTPAHHHRNSQPHHASPDGLRLASSPALSSAATQARAMPDKEGAVWWTEAGGFSDKLLQAKISDLPEVLPCARGPSSRAASWPAAARAHAQAEIGEAFPAASRFLRKLWELVAVGPRSVVEFLTDGGFVVRDMGAFAASVKEAFNSEPTSFSRQIHKYGLRLRHVSVQQGGRASLSNAWRAGRAGCAAWWHPLFLAGRADLLPFVTPRNPNGYGPMRYIGKPTSGAAAGGGMSSSSSSGGVAAEQPTPRTLVEPSRAQWATQTKAAAAGVWSAQSGRYFDDDDNTDDLDDVDEAGDDYKAAGLQVEGNDEDDEDDGGASSRLGNGAGGSLSGGREDEDDDGDDDGRSSAPSQHAESRTQGTPSAAGGRRSAAGSQRRASKRGRRSAHSDAGPGSPDGRPPHGVTMPWDSQAASFRPVARSSAPPAKRPAGPTAAPRVVGGGTAYGPPSLLAPPSMHPPHAVRTAWQMRPPELSGPPLLREAAPAPAPTTQPPGSAPGVLLPGPFDADSTVRPAELRRMRKASARGAEELAAAALASPPLTGPYPGLYTPRQGQSLGGAATGLVAPSLVPARLSGSSLPIATSDTVSLQSGLAPPSLFDTPTPTLGAGSLGAAAMRGLSTVPTAVPAVSSASEAPTDWAALLPPTGAPPAAPGASKGE